MCKYLYERDHETVVVGKNAINGFPIYTDRNVQAKRLDIKLLKTERQIQRLDKCEWKHLVS